MQVVTENRSTRNIEEELFPWLKVVRKKLLFSFPEVHFETLQLLYRSINEEFKILSNSKDKQRGKSFYKILSYFYLHFCWKSNWNNKECHLKSSCVQILYYMNHVALILSDGRISSLWLNKAVSVLRSFPGDPYMMCDALLLLHPLEKKYHAAYAEILKSALRDIRLRMPLDAECFVKIVLLFRRLKCFQKLQLDRREISFAELRIKCPSGVESWLTDLNIEGLCQIKCEEVTQTLLSKELEEGQLLQVLLANKYDELIGPDRKLENKEKSEVRVYKPVDECLNSKNEIVGKKKKKKTLKSVQKMSDFELTPKQNSVAVCLEFQNEKRVPNSIKKKKNRKCCKMVGEEQLNENCTSGEDFVFNSSEVKRQDVQSDYQYCNAYLKDSLQNSEHFPLSSEARKRKHLQSEASLKDTSTKSKPKKKKRKLSNRFHFESSSEYSEIPKESIVLSPKKLSPDKRTESTEENEINSTFDINGSIKNIIENRPIQNHASLNGVVSFQDYLVVKNSEIVPNSCIFPNASSPSKLQVGGSSPNDHPLSNNKTEMLFSVPLESSPESFKVTKFKGRTPNALSPSKLQVGGSSPNDHPLSNNKTEMLSSVPLESSPESFKVTKFKGRTPNALSPSKLQVGGSSPNDHPLSNNKTEMLSSVPLESSPESFKVTKFKGRTPNASSPSKLQVGGSSPNDHPLSSNKTEMLSSVPLKSTPEWRDFKNIHSSPESLDMSFASVSSKQVSFLNLSTNIYSSSESDEGNSKNGKVASSSKKRRSPRTPKSKEFVSESDSSSDVSKNELPKTSDSTLANKRDSFGNENPAKSNMTASNPKKKRGSKELISESEGDSFNNQILVENRSEDKPDAARKKVNENDSESENSNSSRVILNSESIGFMKRSKMFVSESESSTDEHLDVLEVNSNSDSMGLNLRSETPLFTLESDGDRTADGNEGNGKRFSKSAGKKCSTQMRKRKKIISDSHNSRDILKKENVRSEVSTHFSNAVTSESTLSRIKNGRSEMVLSDSSDDRTISRNNASKFVNNSNCSTGDYLDSPESTSENVALVEIRKNIQNASSSSRDSSLNSHSNECSSNGFQKELGRDSSPFIRLPSPNSEHPVNKKCIPEKEKILPDLDVSASDKKGDNCSLSKNIPPLEMDKNLTVPEKEANLRVLGCNYRCHFCTALTAGVFSMDSFGVFLKHILNDDPIERDADNEAILQTEMGQVPRLEMNCCKTNFAAPPKMKNASKMDREAASGEEMILSYSPKELQNRENHFKSNICANNTNMATEKGEKILFVCDVEKKTSEVHFLPEESHFALLNVSGTENKTFSTNDKEQLSEKDDEGFNSENKMGHIFVNGEKISTASLFPVVNLGSRCDETEPVHKSCIGKKKKIFYSSEHLRTENFSRKEVCKNRTFEGSCKNPGEENSINVPHKEGYNLRSRRKVKAL